MRSPVGTLVSLLAVALGATVLSAQTPAQGEAGRVNLVVRPHVGDTLWLHLEQTIETRSVPLAGARRGTGAEGTIGTPPPPTRGPDYGPVRDRSLQSTYMRLDAHSMVESSDLRNTWLSVFTDSLHMRTATGQQPGVERAVVLAPEDRHTRVNVTPDGAMSVVNVRASTVALAAGLSGMPPMLPSASVAIGDRWERDIPLPSLPITGVRTDGVVHAQFRLDSLTKGGRFAYVSLSGTLRRAGAARDLPPGTQVVTAGVLHGYLILDRTRGWITSAETVIDVQSDVTPSPGDGVAGRSLNIHLLQRMWVR